MNETVQWINWFLANVKAPEDFRWVKMKQAADEIERLTAERDTLTIVANNAIDTFNRENILAAQVMAMRDALKTTAKYMLDDARSTLNKYPVSDATVREAEQQAKTAREFMILDTSQAEAILKERDARVLEEAAEESRLLGELLAIIHRDGGHYQHEHGTEKAVEYAIKLIHEWRME